MRSFRGVIVAAAAVVGLATLAIAVGALRLNSYIHSESFKLEVESRATQTMGGLVQVDEVDFSISQGVKLKGLVTQIDPTHSGGQGALKIRVASVNCSYSWGDLLQGRLRLIGVTLDRPQIVLTMQPTPPPPAQALPGGLDSGTTAGPGTALPFQLSLDRAKLRDGSLTVCDVRGTPLVELHGVNIAADTSGYFAGKDVTGRVKIADLVASQLHVVNFSTPFIYHTNYLEAKPFEASAFGGNLAGDYHLDGSGPSVLNVNARGVDLEKLGSATASNSSTKLSGLLDLQSKWLGVEADDPEGEGDAQVIDGKLEGVKMLHELAEVFRIKDLRDPVISSAKTHFVVRDRQIKFMGLELTSIGFQMTGGGVIGFDGSLNADMVLILSREAMMRLPKQAAAFFVVGTSGTGSVAFHLQGTVQSPQTDLATRLFMQNLQLQDSVKKALNKFFH